MSHGFLSTSDRLAQEPLRDRNLHELMVSLCQLAEEQLAELKHQRLAVGETASGQSSVEIKTSTRGVDVTVKAYAGSPVVEAEGEAIASYFRVLNEVSDRLTGMGIAMHGNSK